MIIDWLEEWFKGVLIDGIIGNLSGLFDTVNTKVGEIAADVGATPQGWNSGIFNMIRNLSESVIIPIAGAILAFVMTYELIQMVTEKNNLHDIDTFMFFKWVFKTYAAVLIVTNTWNIVMGVFDAAQQVVNQSAGVIIGNTSIDIDSIVGDLQTSLEAMSLGGLIGLWFQSLFVGLTMNILSICIMLVVYGRMIEIYLDYGGRGHLLGSDPEHFRDGRRVRRDLAGNGLYGAVVLLPVQNGQYGKGRVQRPLTEGLPIGTYNIIYADPPWRYEQRKVQGAAENHYPTMSIDELCALPVPELAAKDCALFLWATFPQLPEALRLIRAWGFRYKTVAFVWLKRNRKSPSWFYGMGYWTRSNAEICLLATKGKPKRQSAGVHQFIISPIEQHSKKPDEARNKILALMGNLPRVELFARQKTPGWDAWGNEIASDITLAERS